MTLLSQSEITGDWNNLKGTDYHLVYAIWLLLRDGATAVSFYEGNDLTAIYSPTTPPSVDSLVGGGYVSVRSNSVYEDIWIQLKSTENDWTVSRLLDDNLLANFICNAVSSESRDRIWKVRLITQADIRADDLNDFLKNPVSKPDLNNKLVSAVHSASERIGKAGLTISKEQLHVTALEILTQLAATQPKRLDKLRIEIELELAYILPDRQAVTQTANTILGTLLKDAAARPSAGNTYNAAWLESVAGVALNTRTLLQSAPLTAYSEEIHKVLPRGWLFDKCVPRPILDAALRRFLESPQTVFVLVGSSGTGKSWAVTRWALEGLADRPRVLIPASDLRDNHTVQSLVGERLRQFAPAEWTDDKTLDHLKAVGTRTHNPVLIIDDLLPPASPDAAQNLRQDLSRIVSQCHEFGMKLVLTCQQHIWLLNALNSEIESTRIFLFHAPSDQVKTSYSYMLGDLSEEEQSAIAKQRLGDIDGNQLISLLRDPAFLPLRNPYLLERYVQQRMAGDLVTSMSVAPAEISNLLDEHVQQLLGNAANYLAISPSDVELLKEALIDCLWTRYPDGISIFDAMNCLGQMGKETIAAFRQTGFITSVGTVRLAEPQTSDHLFAKKLLAGSSELTLAMSELHPEVHTSIVSTLLRMAPDPVPLAEHLLQLNEKWEQAVSDGLAMCDPNDYQVLSILTCLTRPKRENLLGFTAACDSLGRLAARGPLAYRWVARMYLDSNKIERIRGGRALVNLMKYAPNKAAALVRLRLSVASRISDAKVMADWLEDALTPYLEVDPASVKWGYRALRDYKNLLRSVADAQKDQLFDDYDQVRGKIFVTDPDSAQFHNLLIDLASEDTVTRYHAAQALHIISIVDVAAIQDSLLAAIQRETNPEVLKSLLLATSQVAQSMPFELLSAIKTCPLIAADQIGIAAGNALAVLGSIAGRCKNDVFDLLPQILANQDPDMKAMLAEAYASTIWKCAKHNPTAQPILNVLSQPELDNLQNEYHLFAVRGSAIAKQALICLDLAIEPDVAGELMYFHPQSLPVHWMQTDDLLRRHAKQIMSHPGYSDLQTLLLQALEEYRRFEVHPIYKDLYKAQHWCASLCVSMMSAFAVQSDDPLQILSLLPRDWEAMQAVRFLIQAGRRDPRIVDFANRACAEHAKGGSTNAIDERVMLLAALARLSDMPADALNTTRRLLGIPSGFSDLMFGGAKGRTEVLSQLTEARPEQLLALLDSSIVNSGDLYTLHYLQYETHSWQCLLIAQVYARMFSPAQITIREALDLVLRLLSALENLPDNSFADNYRMVYRTIRDCLLNSEWSTPPVSSPEPISPIYASHIYALSLLTNYRDNVNIGETEYADVLYQRQGWWESFELKLKAGSFSAGFGKQYLIYVFPAVRLALVAVGNRFEIEDPVAQFMKQRISNQKVISKHSILFSTTGLSRSHHAYVEALHDMETQSKQYPKDESLKFHIGDLQARMGQYENAVSTLTGCLSMTWCSPETRASAFYDLACAYAQLGDHEQCRIALHESANTHTHNYLWYESMKDDPDLSPVRDEEWFIRLVSSGNSS